jgi:hypothetical protein
LYDSVLSYDVLDMEDTLLLYKIEMSAKCIRVYNSKVDVDLVRGRER